MRRSLIIECKYEQLTIAVKYYLRRNLAMDAQIRAERKKRMRQRFFGICRIKKAGVV